MDDLGKTGFPPHDDVVHARLADQIDFFNTKSQRHRRTYEFSRGFSLILAALITVSPAISILPPWVVPISGALIVATEGLLNLLNTHELWLSCRKTCEDLKRHKYLYLAEAGAYGASNNPRALLAECVEEVLSAENTSWYQHQLESRTKEASRA